MGLGNGRWVEETYQVNGVTLTRTQPEDPAYALLLDDYTSTPNPDIYRDWCYICLDPEFAQMGLSLCKPCMACGGHVAADDTRCDDCGADQEELYWRQCEAECAANGHQWEIVPGYELYDFVRIDSRGLQRSGKRWYESVTQCGHCGEQTG